MYGDRVITGIPERQYYNCRRAYAWLMNYIRKGYKAYYKPSKECCREKQIYKLTRKGNSLYSVMPESNVSIEGLPLIIKDNYGNVIDSYTWFHKPYRLRAYVSQECIQSKKAWINFFLNTGELRCYPEHSHTPFIITNIDEDENGIYSIRNNESGGITKVYLNGFYIYYTDSEGNVDCHKNW